ncbi:MAG: hypothetical protein IJI61_06050 [Oscillospiraceae bacterium]|nr:hypothetical protein [Oscillospiraceae bacterium]
MRKGWKFVGILFVVVLFLGVVFLGVGFLTGGDAERIFQVADASLSITDSFNNYQEFFEDPQNFENLLQGLPF